VHRLFQRIGICSPMDKSCVYTQLPLLEYNFIICMFKANGNDFLIPLFVDYVLNQFYSAVLV
jgi:hypothetical protein